MKKIFISLFSFVLILTGGIFSVNSFSSPVSAAETLMKINDASGLMTLLANPNTYNDKNVTIQLLEDVDMTGVDFSAVSDLNGNFMGVFDGNGYTISNITYTSKSQYYGLFPKATDATIKNIRFAGNIDFEFDETNVKEVYAGVLVGYAENVIFKNIEFDNSNATNKTINLPVYSDFNFGMLAGKVKGNPLASSSDNRANIRDCVNYYNIEIGLNKQTNVYVGGLAGNLQNSYVLNTLNFGNVKFVNNLADGGDSENLNKQYIGGLVGSLSGSGVHLRNSCIGGTFEVEGSVESLNLNKGAIIGGVLDNSVNADNINFVYYSDPAMLASGDAFLANGDKIDRVDVINDSFLKNADNFDEQSQNQPFDFNTVWSLSESQFHLQNFLTFSFIINSSLSTYIDSAQFYVSGAYTDSIVSRYGLPVRIDVKIKPQYVGFFTLKKANLSDNPNFNWEDAQMDVVKNEKEQETEYSITVYANATTRGTYSFDIQSETYHCEVAVSEEAAEEGQGFVKIADSNNSNPTNSIKLQFIYNSPVKKITAEQTSGSKYSFDCWKIYYRNSDGEFSTTEEPISLTDNTISIAFGSSPFDRDFKLVAFFTDEDAISVNFGEINTKKIKSIKFGGIDYDGNPIPVSPNHSKNLEIVTAKNYKLKINAFINTIRKLYGENSTETLITAKPSENESGETTYKFLINMRFMESLSKKNINLPLEVDFDDSNNNNDLLWLWITIGCVGAVLLGVIIFIIIRHRGFGGGRSAKGGKTAKVKEKKVNYKDFY